MSTTAFIESYDSFPEQVKEDLNIIVEYLLQHYRPSASRQTSNLAKPSENALSIEDQIFIAEQAESDIAKGRTLTQIEAKTIAKSWRKK